MEGKELMEKKVFVELNNGRKYSGVIKDVDESLKLIRMIDKFGNPVYFSMNEINVLQVEAR